MKLLFLILLLLTQSQTVRPGTIAGQLLAIDGTPAASIRVSVMEVTDNTQAAPALVGFAQTDAAGRYRIEGLAPGRYYILAGPLNSATYYPGAADLSGATSVALTAGATIEALNFGLSPINQSGVIQAVVLRIDTGAPIVGAQVSLRRPTVSPGQDFLSGVTDTAGQVTFGRLAPGDYNVTVQSEGYVSLSATGVAAANTGAGVRVTATQNEARAVFRLKPAAVVEGRVQTTTGQPIPNAAVSIGQMGYRDGRRTFVQASGATARTDAEGRYRITVADGEYYVRLEIPAYVPVGASQNLPRVAYYPGVTDLVKASVISAKAGPSPTKLDITLSVVEKGFTISGTIINPIPGGRTLTNGTVDRTISSMYLVPRSSGPIDTDSPLLQNRAAATAQRSATGGETPFAIENVPPGDYDFYPLFADSGAAAAQGSGAVYYTARTPVSIRDADITNLRVTLRPGVDLKGRFVSDGPLPQINWESLRLTLRFNENLPTLVRSGSTRAQLSIVDPQTNEFTMPNLPESEFGILVAGLPNSVYVSDMRQSRRSIYADGIIDTRKGTPEPIEFVLKSGASSLQGTVRTAGARNMVVLMPATGSNIQLIKRVGVFNSGVFTITGIAPGDYTIYAFAGASSGNPELDEAFMARHKDKGRAIHLSASQTERVELDLIADPDIVIPEVLPESTPQISNRVVRSADTPIITEQTPTSTPQRGSRGRGTFAPAPANLPAVANNQGNNRGQQGDNAIALIRALVAADLSTAGPALQRASLTLISQNMQALMTAPNQRALAESALQAAQRMDPNNASWHVQLGQLYGLAAEFPNLSDLPMTPAQAATKAVDSYEKAAAMGDTNQVAEMAEFARRANLPDKAKKYAAQALDSGAPDAVHAANSTLGLMAVEAGDIATAKRHLLASGNVRTSGALGSFGPYMSLANELLRRGERDTVIAYLEACLTFWTSGEEQLKSWIATLRAGGTPTLRSFGR